jgi:TPR repeat protein
MSEEINDPYEQAYKEMMKDSPDEKLAFSLLMQSHESGDSRATYALATWYLFGRYVKKDIKKAVTLLKQSADKKVPNALYDLAVCYEKGEGVSKDERQAFDLYMKAALRNESQSVQEVARCYWFGIGVNEDRRTAIIWYERAKELGVGEEDDPTEIADLNDNYDEENDEK